jgi:hypothetical protein
MALLAHQQDAVPWDASVQHRVEEGPLRDDSLGVAVAELELQLFSRVGRVYRGNDTVGIQCAGCHEGRIDAVDGEDAENLAILPIPSGAQCLAKGNCAILDMAERVALGGVRLDVDLYTLCQKV